MKSYNELHNRLLDISYIHNLSHLSSCITTLPILYNIYTQKLDGDIVILSNGHAGLAQYVCMEAFEYKDAEVLFSKCGVHPDKNVDDGIFCSTGSLGLGLPIAIGAAMADAKRVVYCVISDGECCEGSIWESLYFLSKHPLENLIIYVNMNGYSAYDTVDISKLMKILNSFEVKNLHPVDTSQALKQFKFLDEKSIEAHYCKITNDEILKELKFPIS